MVKTCDECGKLDTEEDPICCWHMVWACQKCHVKAGRAKLRFNEAGDSLQLVLDFI